MNCLQMSQLTHVLLLVTTKAFICTTATLTQPESTTVHLEIMGSIVEVEVLYTLAHLVH